MASCYFGGEHSSGGLASGPVPGTDVYACEKHSSLWKSHKYGQCFGNDFCGYCGYHKDNYLHRGYEMDGQTLGAGEKKDEGKPRWELAPYDAIEGGVVILTSGAKKYAARNWEKGISYGRVFGALMRHLWKWWFAKVSGGDGTDSESGKSHLWHAECELWFLIAYERRGMTQFDDRPGQNV